MPSWQGSCISSASTRSNLKAVARRRCASPALVVPWCAAEPARSIPSPASCRWSSFWLITVSAGSDPQRGAPPRLGLIGLLLVVFEDVLGTPRRTAVAIAVGLSAVAFMAYHPLRGEGGGIMPSRVVFYLGAGVYFGILYAARGFGIAVGAHAAYDILAAVLASGARGPSVGGP